MMWRRCNWPTATSSPEYGVWPTARTASMRRCRCRTTCDSKVGIWCAARRRSCSRSSASEPQARALPPRALCLLCLGITASVCQESGRSGHFRDLAATKCARPSRCTIASQAVAQCTALTAQHVFHSLSAVMLSSQLACRQRMDHIQHTALHMNMYVTYIYVLIHVTCGAAGCFRFFSMTSVCELRRMIDHISSLRASVTYRLLSSLYEQRAVHNIATRNNHCNTEPTHAIAIVLIASARAIGPCELESASWRGGGKQDAWRAARKSQSKSKISSRKLSDFF